MKDQTLNKHSYKKMLLRELPLIIPVLVELVVIFMAHSHADESSTGVIYLLLAYASLAASVAMLFLNTEKLGFLGYAVFAIAPATSCLLLESMIRNPFDVKWKILLLNFAFFYLVSLFLLFLTGRTWPATLFSVVYSFAAGVTEHFVLIFRNAPLFPWDLKSVGTAVTVVDNYEFTITYGLAGSISALMLVLILGFKFKAKLTISFAGIRRELSRRVTFITRAVACLLIAATMGGYVYYLNLDRSYTDFGMYPYLFTPKIVYSRNGFTVAFLSMLRYLSVSKPDGYGPEALEALKEESEAIADEKNEGADSSVRPNIIAIMNEAFSDLSILTDFKTNIDYMPFLRSLEENTVKGNLHVSVLGGNTANTEFEFLTGCSMAYLPTGSIPYQQYIKGEIPSLASQLKDLGYSTMAVHPYNSTGWNRNTVYPWMSFDQSYFRTAIKNRTVLRDYVTDSSVYKFIMSKFKQKGDEPMFVFNVTMQNHGSYTKTYDNFNYKRVTATGLESDVKLSTYLSLIRESDDAIRDLIAYFKTYDEPTIIVMFGDHQPAATVSSKLLKKYGVTLNDEDINDLEQRYIVPFYIWANYDIEEAEYGAISANYLSTLLVNIAGIEMTDAQAYLSELYKEYPVVTANAFMDKNGVLHPSDEMEGEELLNKYAMLQYSYLFDDDEKSLFSYDD